MIFKRSLIAELANLAGAVFTVLFTIVLAVAMVRFLNMAAGGSIEHGTVVQLVLYNALVNLPPLLAASLFIATLMTLMRSWQDNEMVVWFSSGGRSILSWIEPTVKFALPIVVVIALLSIVISPWARAETDRLRNSVSAREDVAPVPPEAVVGDMIGGGVRVLIDRLFLWWQGAGAKELPDFESTLQRLVAIWSGMPGDLIREIPGAFAGVQSLKEAGISVWLVTNKERGLTEAFLRERGIDALFNGLVAAGDCAHPKPAPDMLIKAITSAGAEASEAVMVGDSRNDALAARAAGIRAMLVESGYNEGVPLKEWARTAGFNEVFPSVKEVCEELLAQQGSRKCGN